MLQHLLDGVAVGEAGGVRVQTGAALEDLQPVRLLEVCDGLALQDLVPAVGAPLGGAAQPPAVAPAEPLVILLDVVEPLAPPRVGEGHVAAPAGQLQLADHLALVSHPVNLLEVLLYVLHVVLQVATHPEPLRAQEVRRQTELAVDPVEVGGDVHVAGDGLGDGHVELVSVGEVLQQDLDGPGHGGLEAGGALGAAEHVGPVAQLHVLQQLLVSASAAAAEGAHHRPALVTFLHLHRLIPAVQHVDLLALQFAS